MTISEKGFDAAFLTLQQALIKTPLVKNKKAAYGKYMTLDALLDQVLPVLHTCDFYLTQSADDDTLVTEIVHTSGGRLTSRMPIVMPTQRTAMAMGSAITYARRYSLLIMLGVSPDDDDGAAASKNTNS